MGRVGRPAYGKRGVTIGANTPAERVEMIREIEPEPDPTELKAALQRWQGEPSVPSLIRLHEAGDEIEVLEADVDTIDEKLAALFAATHGVIGAP